MKSMPIDTKTYWQAVLFSVISSACLAAAAALAKNMTSMASLPIIIVGRCFCPLILLVVYFLFQFKNVDLKTRYLYAHLMRSFFTVGSQYGLFYVLVHVNILSANLLYATSGLFSPLITRFFLKIHIPIKTIFSIVISFTGVCIALAIWQNKMSFVILIGLSSGMLAALSQISQHFTSKHDSTNMSNIYLFGLSSLYSLLILVVLYISHWPVHFFIKPSLSMILVLFLFSLFSIGNQACKSAAFMRVNKAVSLTPFFYIVILFSGILDWLLYTIIPTWNIWLGTTIIISGGVLMSIRKNTS